MIGIITGASSGIGLGIAKVLAAEGHVVYCISRTGAPKDKREEPDEHIIHIKGDICNSNDMKTLVDTKDIGAMASFLLSDRAKYITGCDYAVDGGALAFSF